MPNKAAFSGPIGEICGLARFEREAKLLASLNHPNIAAIHGFEEDNGTHFLVLELVEGDTLAERLKRGAIPVEESLELALQIAEALEAAHEKGVIHRDLKPSNIKVTPDGKVKVLDFGLAKAFAGDGGDTSVSQSPTISIAATQQGVILGTAAYMSPEQARGQDVDKRTDIWAFGCVLLEMLTSRQAFPGSLASDILAAVIRAEPEWAGFPPSVHPGLKSLLERCLEKNLRSRWQDIGDVRADVERVASDPAGAQLSTSITESHVWHKSIPWSVAAVLAAGVVWLLFQSANVPQGNMTAATFEVVLPDGVYLAVETDHPALALSPDGSQLIFVGVREGVRRLYHRELDDPDFKAIEIEGTEGAASPFFSPDGRQLGFFHDRGLKIVSPDSGVPTDVSRTTPISVNRGATWVDAETFIYAPDANGGQLIVQWTADHGLLPSSAWSPMTEVPAPSAWPHALPGGGRLLFTDQNGSSNTDMIGQFSFETGEVTTLVNGGTNPRYSLTGHVLYGRAGSLYAIEYDLETGTAGDEERLIGDGIEMADTGATQFAVAANGTLAYVDGDLTPVEHDLIWVDREGNVVETIYQSGRRLWDPRLSSDDSQIALASVAGANQDVFVYDIARDNLTPWTSHSGEDAMPVWHPGGGLALFTEIGEGTEQGGPALGWMAGINQGTEQLFTERNGFEDLEFPGSWSPDGQMLAFTATSGSGGDDVYILNVETGSANPFVQSTEFRENTPMFSPDGNWIAYVSNQSGVDEVWIAKYPGGNDPAIQPVAPSRSGPRTVTNSSTVKATA